MFPGCNMEAGPRVDSAGQVLLPGGRDCFHDHDNDYTVTSGSGADGAKDGGGVDGEVEAGVRPRIPPTLNIDDDLQLHSMPHPASTDDVDKCRNNNDNRHIME